MFTVLKQPDLKQQQQKPSLSNPGIRPLKIAFILDSFPSLSETFILNQITGLIDRGHEIDIYAKTGHFSNIHPDVNNYSLLNKCCYLPPSPSNRWIKYLKCLKPIFTLLIHRPKTFPLLLSIMNTETSNPLFRLLHNDSPLIKEKDYDIIQCHYGTNGILGAMLKKFGVKGKLVTMFHGYDIRIAQESNGKIYDELFRFGDCFLSISDYSHNNLIRFGAPKQKIIYHPVGIDLNKFIFKWLVTNNPFTPPVKILTVARLTEEKGLQHGIRAISKLLKKNPELAFEYRIVGEGPLKASLKKQVEESGLNKKVLFLGGMNQKDIIQEMQKAHIFLLPSIEEVLPVVLMESLAIGLPAIATNVGSVSQILSDNKSGFIVEKEDVNTLTDKLLFLIERPELWQPMGSAGRKKVEEHYNINALNDKLVNIYENLISKNY